MERWQPGRRALQPNLHVAQAHRLARCDAHDQTWLVAIGHFDIDVGAIEAERLQGLGRLLAGDAAVAQQLARVAFAQIADVILDVAPNITVGRLDTHLQLGGEQRRSKRQDQTGKYAAQGQLKHGAAC